MADRVSARRATANTYFISIQTAITAALGFLSTRQPSPDRWLLVAMSSVGIVSAAVWYLLLRSYRDLNRAKFQVILTLESMLPIQLFSLEWDSLKKDHIKKWRDRYAELGSVERLAPLLFAILNILTCIYVATA